MPDRRRFSASVTTLGALFAGACSAAAPPVPAPFVLAPPLPPPPPQQPARWVVSREPTRSIPFAGGALVLVGGRRLLLGADGAGRWQTADLPLPLDQVVVVPAAGGARLVGRAGGVVYRFDDPLGPGTPLLPGGIVASRLGAMPGLVVTWDDSPFFRPRFFSVETGNESTPATLPDFPLIEVGFADDRHGAAVFKLWGVSVTHDGGASWQRPQNAGPAGRVLDVEDLGPVDIPAGSLFSVADETAEGAPAPSEPQRARPGVGAMIALEDLLGQDPLATAALAGVAAPDGGAWIPWNGLVLHLDLRTAAATVVARIPDGDASPMPWCDLLRAGNDVWMGCRPRQPDSSLSSVVRMKLEDGTLLPGPKERLNVIATDLRASPSGGVLAWAYRRAGAPAVVSVRQPNGSFQRCQLPAFGMDSSAGPLADGRVALLANPHPGKDLPRVVVVTPASGAKEELPPLELPVLTVAGPIEEDAAGALHFIAAGAEGPFAVTQPLGGAPARIVRLPGAFAARLHGGHGVALGKQSILVSTDSGVTWGAVPAPPSLLATLRKPEAVTFVEGDAIAVNMLRSRSSERSLPFAVGELGAMVGDHLRLGWDAAAALAAAPLPAPVPAPSSVATASPPAGKLHALTCRDAGAALGSLSPYDASWADLEKVKLPQGITADAFRPFREQPVFSSPTDFAPTAVGPFAGALQFAEIAGRSRTAWDQPPSRWMVRWLDSTEIGSRLRTWQGQVPDFDGQATTVRLFHPEPGQNVVMRMTFNDGNMSGLAVHDGRAVFYVAGSFRQASGEDVEIDAGVLVRLDPSGKAELFRVIVGNSSPGLRTAAFTRADAPRAGLYHGVRILDDRLARGGSSLSEATFGSGPGAPIAGILANQLFVWFAGKPMQPIARLPDLDVEFPGQILVGEPTAEGVPLLLIHGSFQRLGVVPIPTVAAADPPVLDAIAWKRPAEPIVPERLPSCDGKAAGATFTMRATEPPLRARVDGAELATATATFEVRVTEHGACVARATVALGATGGEATRFVRADLAGRRAEGGALDAVKGGVRKLQCEWVEEGTR